MAGGNAQPGAAALLIVGGACKRLLEGGDGSCVRASSRSRSAAQHGERIAELAVLRQLPAALRQPQRGVVAEPMRFVLRADRYACAASRILRAIQMLGMQHRLRCPYHCAALPCSSRLRLCNSEE